jgi:hypothetical protein
LFLDAYSPSFNPGDIPADYFADTGLSSSTQSFSMGIAAGESYTLIVHDVPSGAASGSNYNLQFSGCAFSSLIPNHPPVAQAHDVNEVADSNHTASASVDNGSYDPDQGDVITLIQTPPGPYPVGTTSVILTVVDSQGAASQANATVTVLDPNFDLGGLALPAKTVNAGQSATQTITIRPNPGPWNSVVTFSCSGLPALTTCAFNPTSVTPGDSNATTSLTVATTGPNAALSRLGKSWLATWLGFSGLGLFAAASGIRRRRCAMPVFLAMLVFGLLAQSLLSCGGRSTDAPLGATPAGTYPITLTAISGGVSHQAIFPLTVN